MTLTVPAGIVKATDIRYNYEIGGGALMDMGCKPSEYVSPE